MNVEKDFAAIQAEAEKLVDQLTETKGDGEAGLVVLLALRILLAGQDIPMESTVLDLLKLVTDNYVAEQRAIQ